MGGHGLQKGRGNGCGLTRHRNELIHDQPFHTAPQSLGSLEVGWGEGGLGNGKLAGGTGTPKTNVT